MPYYTWNQNQKKMIFSSCTNKKPPVSTDGPPFPIWFILSLYFCFFSFYSCAMGCLICSKGSARIGGRTCPHITVLIIKAIISPFWLYDTVSQSFSPCQISKIYSAWIPLCDIVSQSPDLTCTKKNGLFLRSPYFSPPVGSAVPSTSYKSNSSFILIFNWCFIYASTSKTFFLS